MKKELVIILSFMCERNRPSLFFGEERPLPPFSVSADSKGLRLSISRKCGFR